MDAASQQKLHLETRAVAGSVNVLICDEFAFLKPGVEAEFMDSVFPTVSSSKTSKIIIVSTPHGMNNEFYKIYSRASLDLEDSHVAKELRWHPIRIDWWDVPGRDEKWHQQQLETMGGNAVRFAQEYGNNFLGSVETLITPEKIDEIKKKFSDGHQPCREVQLHKEFEKTKVKIFYAPQKGHAYIIGADPSMGTQSDYHAMSIFDITNTYDIKQVATYYDNDVPPKVFAYMLAKLGALYNNAYIAIENNGCSQVTLDAIWRDYEYDNIINEGGNAKTSVGIHSTNARKIDGCMIFKNIIEDPMRRFEINDGRLIAEIERFEKRVTFGKIPTYAAADGHDDFVMSTIWAMFALKMEIIERYYDVRKVTMNKLGEQMPLFITPFIVETTSDNYDNRNYFTDLDTKLDSFRQNYEKAAKNARDVTSEELEDFIKANNLNAYDPNNEETQRKSEDLRSAGGDDDFILGAFF